MATLDLGSPRSPAPPDAPGDEIADADARLRASARGMDALLTDAEALCPPAAWARVETAIRTLVELYSRGLVRAIGHARAAGVDAATYDERLAGDELVASLLVLHGVHPQPLEDRIRGALARLAVPLGTLAQLAALDADGVAYIRVGACEHGPEIAADAIRRAVTAAAPELARVCVRAEPEVR